MRDKIIKKTVTLALICLLTLFKAQSKKINVLIMIDEKPSLITENLQISSQTMKAMENNYVVGTIDFTEENYSFFLDDQSSDINISFDAILPDHTFASKYLITIPKRFFKQGYIIINVFNMDNRTYRKKYSKLIKNNKEYYVVIETPNSMKFD